MCSTGVESRVVLDDRQKSRLQSSSFLAWKEYYKIQFLYRRIIIHYGDVEEDQFVDHEDQKYVIYFVLFIYSL